MKFRKLKAEEIDCRVGQVTAKGYTILLYKDARCDMNILDETVGAENWQRDHKEVKGNLYCGVGICNPIDRTWNWKWDCGVESNTEKEKGEASDSFKRSCVNWGIGRELYTSPFIFIQCKTEKRDGKGYDLPTEEKYNKMKVAEIDYNDNGEIDKLVIIDNNGVVRFTYGSKPKTVEDKTKEDNNLIIGAKFVFSSGNFKGKTIEDADKEDHEYLDKLLAWDKLSDLLRKNIMKYKMDNQTDVEV